MRAVSDFGTRSNEKRGGGWGQGGEKCNGNKYIYHFYSLVVEASFGIDAGRLVGSFTK